MGSAEPVKLRILTFEDLESVTEIDFQLLGKRRRDYWETRLERSAFCGVPSLAAEVDGKMAGFVLGTVSGWEYGIPESVAWIDTMGVLKEYQSKGVARLLLTEMTAMFKKVGIHTVYTFVNWRDLDLLQFFDKMGFTRGDMIHLELTI